MEERSGRSEKSEEGGGKRRREEEGGGGRRREEEGGGRRREEEGGGRRREEEGGGGRRREEEGGGRKRTFGHTVTVYHMHVRAFILAMFVEVLIMHSYTHVQYACTVPLQTSSYKSPLRAQHKT